MAYWSQNDFSGGLSERAYGKPNSLSVLDNGYVHRDGTIRKRGPKPTFGTLAIGASIQATSDVLLSSGETVFGLYMDTSANTISSVNLDTFAEVDLSTGLLWWNGSSWASITYNIDRHINWCNAKDELIFSCGGGDMLARWYMGNKQTYSTGTVAGSSGSPTLTGTSTVWSSNVEEGMYFCTADSNPKVYRVLSVNSNTSITLDRNLSAALSGASYSIQPIAPVTTENTNLRKGSTQANILDVGSWALTFHNGRIFYTDPDDNTTLRWSGTTVDVGTDSSYVGVQVHDDNAFFKLTPSATGEFRTLLVENDSVVALGQKGISSLRGSVATDGTDLGASEKVISDTASFTYSKGFAHTPLGVVIALSSGLWILREGSLLPWAQELDFPRGDDASISYAEYPSPRLFVECAASSAQDTYSIYEYDFDTSCWSTQSFSSSMSVPITNLDGTNVLGLEASGKIVQWEFDRFPDSFAGGALDGGSTTQPRLTVQSHPIQLNPDVGKPGRPRSAFVSGDVDTALSVECSVGVQGNLVSSATDDEYTSTFAQSYQRFPFTDNVAGPFAFLKVYQETADDSYLDNTDIMSIGLEFEPSNEL